MQGWQILQTILCVVGTAVILYISRKPLSIPGAHGFYRFFAWEAILALAVLNLPVWFRDPFSLAQVTSWLLLILSAFLVIHGVHLLDVVGKAGTRAQAPAQSAGTTAAEIPGAGAKSAGTKIDQANFAFENTSKLVRVGAYRFIRHPLYASLLYLAWGIYLKQPAALLGLGLALAASVFLWLTARADEAECKRSFGGEYSEYMKQTRMFIPYVF